MKDYITTNNLLLLLYGQVKLNFDGAFDRFTKTASMVGILRDEDGKMLSAFIGASNCDITPN